MVEVDRRTLAEQVFEALKSAILEGRYPPGSELQEVGLATSFEISRGPIREALGRLSAEGLVTIRPRRGAVVTGLDRQEFLEAYQVREALEVLAIRLAVRNRTDRLLTTLDRLMKEMNDAADHNDVDRFFEANSAFHRAFVDASDNRKLQQVHAQVVGTMGRYRRRSLALRGDLRPSIEEHRRIVAAVRDGDEDSAAELLAHHIGVPQQRLSEVFEDEPDEDLDTTARSLVEQRLKEPS